MNRILSQSEIVETCSADAAQREVLGAEQPESCNTMLLQDKIVNPKAKKNNAKSQKDDVPSATFANLSIGAKPVAKSLAKSKASALASSWTCSVCNREMQCAQMEGHLAGKKHIACLNTKKIKQNKPCPVQAAGTNGKHSRKASSRTKTTTATTASLRAKSQQQEYVFSFAPMPQRYLKVPAYATNGRAEVGSPDCGFSGFNQTSTPSYYGGIKGSCLGEGDYGFGDEDYSICDKDCGWCGHCIFNIDVWNQD